MIGCRVAERLVPPVLRFSDTKHEVLIFTRVALIVGDRYKMYYGHPLRLSALAISSIADLLLGPMDSNQVTPPNTTLTSSGGGGGTI